MPRANRYLVENQIYHLTHRCHDREFLLRFGRDRSVYREWLRQGVRRYGISLFGYCITSNHVHLVATAPSTAAISRLMDLVEGAVAGHYNRRKHRSGGFWTGRFHDTLIDRGEYLWNCLQYVDLNMVRAGVVGHPEQWRWNGYRELLGERQRYRLLDLAGLVRVLGMGELGVVRERYRGEIAAKIAAGQLPREAQWTESLAVGGEAYVRQMSLRLTGRQELRMDGVTLAGGLRAWTLRESVAAYA